MDQLTISNNGQLVQYSTMDVLEQVKSIQNLMSAAMKENEHYGKIPGCGDKPTLLKSGAEKINFMFRLAPKYLIKERLLEKGHREYEIITELYHINSGKFIGQGVGSASTMESKWRYRTKTTFISNQLPEDYQQNKNHYKEQGFVARKDDNKWNWLKVEKLEHDNPADNYNTVLKMAKKRSLVDATLTGTAASDIFTQDIEELVDNGVIEVKHEIKQEPKKEAEQVSTEVKANYEVEAPKKSHLDVALKEIEKGSKWNGQVYKNGTVYLNGKKFELSENEIAIFKSKAELVPTN